ncbi:unnamed protein product [Closterium sp. Naga37s-1]|nr:unnamed protein product [Closterium sp. Naga37s-1]
MEVVAESPCPNSAAADVGYRARAPQLRQRAPAESSAGCESRPPQPGAGRRAANATRSRQYLARWTPEEDAVLLEHVMAHGTAEWGQLRASGRLPLRDNKACCNRFLLLKRKFLQLDDYHHEQEKHCQQHYQQYRQQQHQNHNGQLQQQHDISPWPCLEPHAHPAALPCCFQPADTALHLMATAPQAYPQAAEARQQAIARLGRWEGEWRGNPEGVAWWEAAVDPRVGSAFMHAHGWDATVGCVGVIEPVSRKSACVQDSAVVLQRHTDALKQQQQQQICTGGVRPCVEQAVKAGTSAAPSACVTVLHLRPTPTAPPAASTHLTQRPLAPLHPPLAAYRGTIAAPAAAGAAIGACVGEGPSNRQPQADLDRWVLEQVGLMLGGQGGAAPGDAALLADVRGGEGGGVGGELGGMGFAAGDGGCIVGHGGKRTKVSGGGEWDEQQGETCIWEGTGSHCGGWMGGEGGGRKTLDQDRDQEMPSQEGGHWHDAARESCCFTFLNPLTPSPSPLSQFFTFLFPRFLPLSQFFPLLLPPFAHGQEDAVLLEHVMAHGTAEWGQLRASGRLPLRDNKACCNRFLLLKRKFLQHEQLHEQHHEQQQQQPQPEFPSFRRPHHPPRPSGLPCGLQPRDTALHSSPWHLTGTAPAGVRLEASVAAFVKARDTLDAIPATDMAWPPQPRLLEQPVARRTVTAVGWKGSEWQGVGAAWHGMMDPWLERALIGPSLPAIPALSPRPCNNAAAPPPSVPPPPTHPAAPATHAPAQPPLASVAAATGVGAGALEGQRQADLDRWILEQVGLMAGGQGGSEPAIWA